MSKIGILYNKNNLKGLALAEQLLGETLEFCVCDGENEIVGSNKNPQFKSYAFEDGTLVAMFSVDKLSEHKFDFDTLYIEEETSKMFNKDIMFKLYNDKSKGSTFIFNEYGRKNFI